VSSKILGPLESFANGEARQVRVDGRTLVVVRIDDQAYVLDDRCSHEDFSLSLGEVDAGERTIECARHGAIFSLKDGSALTFPATQPVAHYDVRIVDGVVEVDSL
jgi:3-phenylpropionate/trans-cinnamate dioxygenase ferredoxin component